MALSTIKTASITDDAVTTPKVSDGVFNAHRNLIINGAMQVWQRGTSFTTSSSGTFSADRWASNAGASTVFSRSTDVPTGFHYSLSVAGSAYTGIRTRIEAADCKRIAGQEVTFSWYAKRTAGTGDMKTYLGYASAEDNFGTVTLIEEVVNTASASVSSDWARYTYTVTLPANAANGLHFVVFNGSASGAVTTLYTGVQLEVGSIATPFEHEMLSDTLHKCQRYYEKSHDYGTAPTHGFSGTGFEIWQSRATSGTSAVYYTIQYKVRKRASASVTTFNNTASGAGYYHISGNADYTNGSINGGDRKFSMRMPSTGNQNEYLFSWVSDAEL